MTAIELLFEKGTETKNAIQCQLLNVTDGTIVFNQPIEVTNQEVRVYIEENREEGLKRYELSLSVEEKQAEKPISVLATIEKRNLEGTLYYGDNEQAGNLFLKIFVPEKTHKMWIIYAFLVASVSAVFAFLILTPMNLEHMYLVSVIAIGMLYFLLFTPATIPDESAHIETAYRLSNQLMGKGYAQENGKMQIRVEDLKMCQLYANNTISNPMQIWNDFKLFSFDKEVVEIEARAVSGNYMPYLPAVIGITLGRILGLGCYPMLYLARIFNLALFIMTSFWGIKKIPIGKKVMIMVCLLPMTMQQAGSFSYDAIINGLMVFIVGLEIKMIFDIQNSKIKRIDLLLCLTALFWMVNCKSGVYVFLGALLLFLPDYKNWDKKKVMNSSLVVSVLGIVFICFNNQYIIKVVQSVINPTNIGASEFFTIADFVANPEMFVKLLINTILKQTNFYLETMIGSDLGWFQIKVPELIIMSFIILLIFASIHEKDECWYLNKKIKVGMFLISSAVFLSVELALALTNVTTQEHIGAVQGRYFLPILPLLLFLFDNVNLKYEESRAKHMIVSAGILHLIISISIMKYTLQNIF